MCDDMRGFYYFYISERVTSHETFAVRQCDHPVVGVC